MSYRKPLVLISVALAAATGKPTAARAQGSDSVWVWNDKCPNPTSVRIRVRLDSATVYHTSIHICRWARQWELGELSFRYSPARQLVW